MIYLAIICALLAVLGSVLPVIPGPLLAYGALWLARLSEHCPFTDEFMVIMGIVTAIVFLLDLFLPPMVVRAFGGSKAAGRGAMVGMLLGIIFTPIGMFLGMIIGAFIFELLISKRKPTHSLKATMGAVLGFILGTGIKLALCGFILWEIVITGLGTLLK